MTPVFQSPVADSGYEPNCIQASLASLLDMPLSSVPAFHHMPEDEWKQSLMLWVSTEGYDFYQQWGAPVDDQFYLGIYEVEGGLTHCVVCQNGKVVHDPFMRQENEEYIKPMGSLLYCWILRDIKRSHQDKELAVPGNYSNHGSLLKGVA